MNSNNHKKIGEHRLIGGLIIDIISTIEPCYRLSQYGKGLPITCKCSVCKTKDQTPEEAKQALDKIYKK